MGRIRTGIRVISLAVTIVLLAGLGIASTAGSPASRAATFQSLHASAAAAQVITRGPSTRRVVALTFDAGSDRGATQKILDILRAQHIPATFSLTGHWTKQYPKMARAIVQGGHQLVNHTYDHRSFTGYSTKSKALTDQQRRWELEQAERTIRGISSRSTKPYFRPPYGDYDRATLRLAGSLGYRYVLMWTVDSLGWKGIPASQVTSRCLAASRPGEIILMHVGAQSTDVSALPSVISQLKKRGYGFVTVSRLLSGR